LTHIQHSLMEDPVSEPYEAVMDNLILIGDAARQVDPITGGGLIACLDAGRIAGEVLGKAVEKQNFSSDILKEYENRAAASFYKKMKRNYAVKEIMLGFEDKTLNMLADSLKDVKFDEISTLELIKALVLRHPSLMIKLRPLMKAAKR